MFIPARACRLRTLDSVSKQCLHGAKCNSKVIYKHQTCQKKNMVSNANISTNSPLMSAVKCNQLFKSYNSRWKRSKETATRTYSLLNGAAENCHNSKSSYGVSTLFLALVYVRINNSNDVFLGLRAVSEVELMLW